VITAAHRWKEHLATLTERYLQWEERRTRRIRQWAIPKRWCVFVLVPLVIFCAGGVVAGVPVLWVLRITLEASRGAPSPDAAVNSYLMALSYDNDEGLVVVLDNHHQDELLRQWRAYRNAMKHTDPAPSKLEIGPLTLSNTTKDHATVTADVAATWWNTDTNGRQDGYRSSAHTWRFTTHEDNGWLIDSVQAPAWCGTYVVMTRCG
jgi:hypothetical protein